MVSPEYLVGCCMKQDATLDGPSVGLVLCSQEKILLPQYAIWGPSTVGTVPWGSVKINDTKSFLTIVTVNLLRAWNPKVL